MGEITITGQRTEVRFKYQDARVVVTGTLVKNSGSDMVENLSANICKNVEGQPGENVGNITGYRTNAGMRYGMGDVPTDYLGDVQAAIVAIEQEMNINGEEADNEQES